MSIIVPFCCLDIFSVSAWWTDRTICCVCGSGEETDDNLIIFCDGCYQPIHKACTYNAQINRTPKLGGMANTTTSTRRRTATPVDSSFIHNDITEDDADDQDNDNDNDDDDDDDEEDNANFTVSSLESSSSSSGVSPLTNISNCFSASPKSCTNFGSTVTTDYQLGSIVGDSRDVAMNSVGMHIQKPKVAGVADGSETSDTDNSVLDPKSREASEGMGPTSVEQSEVLDEKNNPTDNIDGVRSCDVPVELTAGQKDRRHAAEPSEIWFCCACDFIIDQVKYFTALRIPQN